MAADELAHDLNLQDANVGILADDMFCADAVASGCYEKRIDFVPTGTEPPLFADLAAFGEPTFIPPVLFSDALAGNRAGAAVRTSLAPDWKAETR